MKIKRYTSDDEGYHGELGFICPGCGHRHFINDNLTEQTGNPIWTFNGDFEKPTIRASVLTYCPTQEINYRCHSFITDGMIQFLSDCTHSLAGQTVELPEIEEAKK